MPSYGLAAWQECGTTRFRQALRLLQSRQSNFLSHFQEVGQALAESPLACRALRIASQAGSTHPRQQCQQRRDLVELYGSSLSPMPLRNCPDTFADACRGVGAVLLQVAGSCLPLPRCDSGARLAPAGRGPFWAERQATLRVCLFSHRLTVGRRACGLRRTGGVLRSPRAWPDVVHCLPRPPDARLNLRPAFADPASTWAHPNSSITPQSPWWPRCQPFSREGIAARILQRSPRASPWQCLSWIS